jgi:hypothetical protein
LIIIKYFIYSGVPEQRSLPMTPSLSLPSSHRSPSLLLIAVLHLGLLYALLKSQAQPERELDTSSGPAITWLRATPPAPSRPVVKTVVKTQVKPVNKAIDKPLAGHQSIPAAIAPSEPQANVAAPAEETPVPATSRAADILAQARRDISKIDKDLRKEFPLRDGMKFEDTGFKRMQQDFADAYAAVPPKWHEASRVEEISADLIKGVRIYKITSALGTLCITMRAGKSGESEIGICPK